MRATLETLPRRRSDSALLLALSLALLASVLVGFAGARTALAQAGDEPKEGDPQPPPKEQPQPPPKEQPQPPPKEQPQPLPTFETATLTAFCDLEDGEVRYIGDGFSVEHVPWVDIRLNGHFYDQILTGDGTFFGIIKGMTPGEIAEIEAQDGGALYAPVSTTVRCPETQRPAITASCDPVAQQLTVIGTEWFTGQVVTTEITAGEDEVLGSVSSVPDWTGYFESGVRGSFTAGETLTLEARSAVPHPVLIEHKASTTVECSETPGGGTTVPEGRGGGGESGGGSSGGGVIPSIGEVFSGLLNGRLPETGGGWSILLIAGAILIALGWLLVRLARRFAAR